MGRYELAALAQWQDTAPGRDPSHIVLHLAKKVGKIAAYFEDFEHGDVSAERCDRLLRDDIPDLAILAAMFAVAMEPNYCLNDAIQDRGAKLIER